MGGPPYKPAKRGWVLFYISVSTFDHKRAPMYVYSDSLPPNLLKYWTNDNMKWSCRSSSDGTQHSEQQNATLSVV